MKLLFCVKCADIVALNENPRTCKCGGSWGMYLDDVRAVVGGRAEVIGINNRTFRPAFNHITTRPAIEYDEHRQMEAWFFSRQINTVRVGFDTCFVCRQVRSAGSDNLMCGPCHNAGSSAYLPTMGQLKEWRKSILGLVKTWPEFDALPWTGDKEGWGFVFELIKLMHKQASGDISA